MKKEMALLIAMLFIVPTSIFAFKNTNDNDNKFTTSVAADQPKNVTVIVKINKIRAMSVDEKNPAFYLKVLINGVNAIWWQQEYKGKEIELEWPVASLTVNYTNGVIPIQIELWKKGLIDRPCDIGRGKSPYLEGKAVTIFYNLTTGEWYGDDWLNDSDGYGHVSGFEDGNYNEDDCEIWFDVYERYYNISTHDRMTYWDKLKYGLDPTKNYDDVDIDEDGIPSWWEDKYGYSPIVWNNHSIDPDNDGLTNYEEWETSQWYSDPFAKDIFVEVDFMKAEHPWQADYTFPKESQWLVETAFARHNITLHIDDGWNGGGDYVPYDDALSGKELQAIRWKYFMDDNAHNWKRGVFHYALMCSNIYWSYRPAGGRMFYIDSFTVGVQYVRDWLWALRLQGSDYYTALASVWMHELGHNLGIFSSNSPGCDNDNTRFPWQAGYWKYGNYKSCMNYRYVFKLVDYSDGSHGENDFDDWGHLDLTQFNGEAWWI
ncbi:MAG: hypothetical protein FE045_02985 [Thermoplasmata archaeon]|nr:MAG: hypothetical protein FE045_02985 [Thermoplasmata archaeon]